MNANKLPLFEQAIDLTPNVFGSTGACPACRSGKLTLKMTGTDTFDVSCAAGCTVRQITDAVTRIVTGNGGNGKHEPEVASIASVATFYQQKGQKPPQNLELEAYYGLPGRVMRAIAPHTESHDAGILGSFLTGGGCLIGPKPHVYRDGQRHACNEFALLVGKTGSGRKGSASRRIDEVFSYCLNTDSTESIAHEEESSYKSLILRGLGSGEALVAALAEEDDLGETEPRRLIFEQEFARCLKVMAREGSTLSDVIRAAWDSDPMHVRTKGSTLRADSSHVSILAHVTEADLRERMAQADLFNGFANRFLWFATSRARSLPFGGGNPPIEGVVREIHNALEYSRSLYRMEFDEDCFWLWDDWTNGGCGIYELLSKSAPGLLGAVTDRAAAHVTRVAMQYAVWDKSGSIQVPHLLAGLAVWDYSEKTCAAVFGRSTGDSYADTILENLREAHPGFLTRKDIRDLFSRHAAPGRIPIALDLLEETGMIERRKMETEGRSAEIIALLQTNHCDLSDKSPLETAREWAKTRGYATEAT